MHSPYLSPLDFSNSPVWNIQFDELDFFPSFNWIFTACVACKNPDQTWNFKLENVKNQVQIENALGSIGESLQMMCVFNGYVGEKNNALIFFFFCPGINYSDMKNQEFEFVEINYPGMNSTLQL